MGDDENLGGGDEPKPIILPKFERFASKPKFPIKPYVICLFGSGFVFWVWVLGPRFSAF